MGLLSDYIELETRAAIRTQRDNARIEKCLLVAGGALVVLSILLVIAALIRIV